MRRRAVTSRMIWPASENRKLMWMCARGHLFMFRSDMICPRCAAQEEADRMRERIHNEEQQEDET